MRVGAITSSSFGAHLGPERRRAARTTAPKAECRTLAPVTVPPRSERRTHHLPSAPFLAHLIATKSQAPQTRTRRRGEPAEAALAYGHRNATTDAGTTLSRKM